MENKADKKYVSVIDAIRQKIMSGEYPPGFKLSGQNILAGEFAVSPITTKRALSELQKTGYIERRSRSGSYVSEKPRVISEVNIVIGDNIENETLWLSGYWEGIESGAQALNIPCQLMKTTNPAFKERVLNGTATQGVILLSFEDMNIMKQLSSSGIPFVVGEIEARYADYNVYINRRRLTAALVETMHADGIRKIAFFGNLAHPNHFTAGEGYRAAIHDLKQYPPMIYDVNEDTLVDEVSNLLSSPDAPDGLIIAGGGLPFAALPAIGRIKPDTKLGVITENKSVLRLKDSAYIASFSQFEAGKLTFELLYNIAARKIMNATTWFPPFEIM
ncbi:MAG: GntR family transcriptional regulator, partial [Victivallaceae bacterium]